MERRRQLFEDVERYMDAASEALFKDSHSQRKRIARQHQASVCLGKISEAAQELLEEAKGDKEEEGEEVSTAEALKLFYAQLEEVKKVVSAFEAAPSPYAHLQEMQVPVVHFSGEESYGRHLDLHAFHQRALNLEAAAASESLSYREYVNSFYTFLRDPRANCEEYATYVEELLAYLVGFLRRAEPLLDADLMVSTIEEQVEHLYDAGTRCQWDEVHPSAELYCVECSRSFAKHTVLASHKLSKRHKASVKRYEDKRDAVEALARRVFCAQSVVERLVSTSSTLADTIQATTINIDKKMARTLREQIQAMEEESDDSDDMLEEQDEEEQVVRNIKNYPVGWDGEPIPYWLYRLHGLGVEYKCEICGNISYWGRRPFEKHFSEQRHQQALKLLGVPYRAELFDVTRIRDAVDLYKKLVAEEEALRFNPESDVEMEDASGNVYDLKTYMLMSKQGLIKK